MIERNGIGFMLVGSGYKAPRAELRREVGDARIGAFVFAMLGLIAIIAISWGRL